MSPTTFPLADWLPGALAAEGAPFRATPGWATRCARHKAPGDTGLRRTGAPYLFDPVAVMNHHDAMNEQIPAQRIVDLMVLGRGGADPLPGPLCNIWLDDDGVAYLIAAGNANHAGMGSSLVLERVLADRAPLGDAADRHLVDDMVGNPHFIGIEVNGADGILTPAQERTLVLLNAAICRHHRWSANRCIHHRQWTRRKPDMAWRGPLVEQVRARLAVPLTPAPQEDHLMAIVFRDPRTRQVFLVEGGRKFHIERPALAALQQMGATKGEPVESVELADLFPSA